MKNQPTYSYTETLKFDEQHSFLDVAHWSNGILTVTMLNGKQYDYKTPRCVLRHWRKAPSKGYYFAKTVKEYSLKK